MLSSRNRNNFALSVQETHVIAKDDPCRKTDPLRTHRPPSQAIFNVVRPQQQPSIFTTGGDSGVICAGLVVTGRGTMNPRLHLRRLVLKKTDLTLLLPDMSKELRVWPLTNIVDIRWYNKLRFCIVFKSMKAHKKLLRRNNLPAASAHFSDVNCATKTMIFECYHPNTTARWVNYIKKACGVGYDKDLLGEVPEEPRRRKRSNTNPSSSSKSTAQDAPIEKSKKSGSNRRSKDSDSSDKKKSGDKITTRRSEGSGREKTKKKSSDEPSRRRSSSFIGRTTSRALSEPTGLSNAPSKSRDEVAKKPRAKKTEEATTTVATKKKSSSERKKRAETKDKVVEKKSVSKKKQLEAEEDSSDYSDSDNDNEYDSPVQLSPESERRMAAFNRAPRRSLSMEFLPMYGQMPVFASNAVEFPKDFAAFQHQMSASQPMVMFDPFAPSPVTMAQSAPNVPLTSAMMNPPLSMQHIPLDASGTVAQSGEQFNPFAINIPIPMSMSMPMPMPMAMPMTQKQFESSTVFFVPDTTSAPTMPQQV